MLTRCYADRDVAGRIAAGALGLSPFHEVFGAMVSPSGDHTIVSVSVSNVTDSNSTRVLSSPGLFSVAPWGWNNYFPVALDPTEQIGKQGGSDLLFSVALDPTEQIGKQGGSDLLFSVALDPKEQIGKQGGSELPSKEELLRCYASYGSSG
jgi:hypothetical protein